MLEALEEAFRALEEENQAEPVIFAHLHHTGRRGRPARILDPDILALLYQFRGPAHLAKVFDCSARTVRRTALDYGIVEPCPPVYVEFDDPNTGHRFRLYQSSTAPVSTLTDNELDSVLSYILEIFPAFGRRMITGHLKHMGHNVPRERLRSSYERVAGAPASLLAQPVQRKKYSVPHPNALWHHDGQHGKSYHTEQCIFIN